jgi:hypothetical protein
MERKAEVDPFGKDVEFPAFPADEVPENALAIRRILAGQRSLRALYAGAAKLLADEAGLIAGLLRRDWDRCFGDLLRAGQGLLDGLGSKGKDGEDSLPPPAQVEKIAASLRGAPVPRVLHVLSAFASRALISTQLIPWSSDVQEVFEHFQRCCEAEDRHFAVLDLFGKLVEA